MCHMWVEVTPFSTYPRGDRFCPILTGGLSFRHGGMVSPVMSVATAICTVRVSMRGGKVLCGGVGEGGGEGSTNVHETCLGATLALQHPRLLP